MKDGNVYGRAKNKHSKSSNLRFEAATWMLARMKLSIRGINVQIVHGDAIHSDEQPNLSTDYVLAPTAP